MFPFLPSSAWKRGMRMDMRDMREEDAAGSVVVAEIEEVDERWRSS